ncbi:hypothetical protein KR222_005838 [Zaprionus bogoriensis]|nr:hypothetical protein KR222_005838 [Zaprionus bogoriensis]
MRLRILEWYHNYAMVIGVTSHRLVAGKLRWTWLTRSWTLLVNTIQVITLPCILWVTAEYSRTRVWFPNLVPYSVHMLCLMSYLAIAFTIFSRARRDSIYEELQPILAHLRCRYKCNVGSFLHFLLYLKTATLLYLCLSPILNCLIVPEEYEWKIIFIHFCLNHATNVPVVASHLYFVTLWLTSSCYRHINCRLEDFINCGRSRKPTRNELRRFHRLWSLHAMLGRCVKRVNKDYGQLMLAARLDFVFYSAIGGYCGMLFIITNRFPIFARILCALGYSMRLLDFFLLDTMCDLTVQYQSAPHHEVSEGMFLEEVNAFLLYSSTAKLELSVCGLFTMNRIHWFNMLGFIISICVLLLQFHLVISNEFQL